MLVPASTFRQVGLLDERFFLYCEEVDHAERCRRVGRQLVVSTDAIVQHRFGATIGSSRSLRDRSQLSAYHASRSAVLLVRRHRPWLLPSAWAARMAWGARLAVRGPRALAWPTIKGATGALLATRRGEQ
jgi:GT2 family glycosyltransferase